MHPFHNELHIIAVGIIVWLKFSLSTSLLWSFLTRHTTKIYWEDADMEKSECSNKKLGGFIWILKFYQTEKSKSNLQRESVLPGNFNHNVNRYDLKLKHFTC